MSADPRTELQRRHEAMGALRDLLVWECPIRLSPLVGPEELQAAMPRMPPAWQRAWRAHVAYQTAGRVILNVTEPPAPAGGTDFRSYLVERVVGLLKAKWERR